MNNLDYGIIGNCKSAALISKTGSIDWCCLPDFDSMSVFARLLDREKGGCFSIQPEGDYSIQQSYIRKTNILMTRFSDGDNAFELIDFMPRYRIEPHDNHCPPDLIRYVRLVSGQPQFRVLYDPRLNYGQGHTKTIPTDIGIKSTVRNGIYESLYLYTDMDCEAIVNQQVVTLAQDAFLLVSYNQKINAPTLDSIQLEFELTKVYWMGWLSKTKQMGQYQNVIERSALVLKLLAYQKTGAVLAAVTTSLPESIGSGRNWDYRFCWIRDASMTISIMTGLRHYNVAKRFLRFILDVIAFKNEKIQIMYGINGQRQLKERILPWLDGYEGSGPVRVGNAAYTQKQNDIYGVLMDVILQYLLIYKNTIDSCEDLWTVVRTLARHVRNNWARPDGGIWEIRSGKRHFVFSKVLCWVALDRAVKIAQLLGKASDAQEWGVHRDRIRADILKKGWNETLQSFTQSYGDENLDASNLLIEHYGFVEPTDPRYVSTVRRSYEELCQDGLMYRYKNQDDFGRPESSFTVCTLWMIKSLYRIGEKDLARSMFDQLLQYGNHLGLFSEDIEFKTKRLLGNFPQGYSHLALIDTAIQLSEGVDERIAFDQPDCWA
jgi:alpha,alpha-trehalase